MTIKTEHLFASIKEDVAKATQLLREGHPVAVPTETVYGLAADARQEKALAKLFEIKKRPTNHPLIVHVASIEEAKKRVSHFPKEAEQLAEDFWPGPLTLILKKASDVSLMVTGGLETVAIRVPQNEVLRSILTTLKTGVAAPSANLHKQLSPTQASHVLESLSGSIAAVLDDGPCLLGLESTIIDLTQSPPVLLRPGPLLPSQLASALKDLKVSSDTVYQAPGGMKAHYQPKASATICSLEDIYSRIATLMKNNVSFGILYHSADAKIPATVKTQLMPNNSVDYAQKLYASLHHLDKRNLEVILIESPPTSTEWIAVWDRLNRATALKH